MKEEMKGRVDKHSKCCEKVYKEIPCPIQVNGIFWCKEHFNLFRPYLWGLNPKYNWAEKLFNKQ